METVSLVVLCVMLSSLFVVGVSLGALIHFWIEKKFQAKYREFMWYNSSGRFEEIQERLNNLEERGKREYTEEDRRREQPTPTDYDWGRQTGRLRSIDTWTEGEECHITQELPQPNSD